MITHPRESELLGQARAEAQCMQAITSGRLPHAWLLHGPRGIGKATLAYRFAKFLLAGGAESAAASDNFDMFGAPEQTGPKDMSLPADAPTSRRIISGTHADLLVLDSESETRKRQEINVEEAREVAHFLSLTPSEANWRVVIIDSADALNPAAANALLKLIEEPPPQAMILLLAHQLGRVLPTIRSRTRLLPMLAPTPAAFDAIIENALPTLSEEEREAYRLLADGAPGQAIQLHEHGVLRHLEAWLNALPMLKSREGAAASLAYVDGMLSGDDGSRWQMFCRLLNRTILLSSRIHADPGGAQYEMLRQEQGPLEALAGAKSLDSWLTLWDKSQQLISDTDRLNLDRKQTALQLLQAVAA